VCTGFDGAPVVTCGDDHRIYAVHDAFVVGRGSVGIGSGKGVSRDDAISHILALEVVKCKFLKGNSAPGPRDSPVRQVGEDPQMDFSSRDRFDLRGKPLTGCVDRVRAHCVPDVIDEMDDEESADRGVLDDSHFQIPCATAKFLENGVYGIRFGDQLCLVLVDLELCLLQIPEVDDLHLANHERLTGSGFESAAGAGKFGHKRSTCYHRRFFQSHWDEHIPSIDHEIERNPQRQAVQADDILDHMIGSLRGQPATVKWEQILGSLSRLGEFGTTLLQRHVVESSDTGICHGVHLYKSDCKRTFCQNLSHFMR
jgi:hypothetical protein